MDISIDYLSEYLRHLDFHSSMELTWRQTEQTSHQSLPWKGDELPWNGLSCLSVVCYVLKFCSNAEHNDVIDTITRLNNLASEHIRAALVSVHDYALFGIDSCNFSSAFSMMKRDSYTKRMQSWKIREKRLQYPGKRQEISETFVNTFLPKVQQFFILNSKRNENLAGFIHFLLQILNSESNHVRYEGLLNRHALEILKFVAQNFRYQRLGSVVLKKVQICLQVWLQRSLNFILTVLGDVPFQFIEANNLISEFEVMANEAASLIYKCFFRTCPINACQISEHVVVLSQKFNLLKVKIQERCIEISKLPIPICADPNTAADSEFIVDSLLEDLNNFMTSRKDLASGMKQQITPLHEELLHAQSFFKDANVPEVTEIQDLKDCMENIGYDLCGYCYSSASGYKLPARYSQKHTSDHKFEIVTPNLDH